MGFLLFIIAVVLTIITVPFGILYGFIKCLLNFDVKTLFRKTNKYFKLLAISIDQMGNVAMQDLFNDILILKKGYKFGDEDETISSVLGKNERTQTLTNLGRSIVSFLNFIDPNHALNSIEEKP
jgi:hypothetical protein